MTWRNPIFPPSKSFRLRVLLVELSLPPQYSKKKEENNNGGEKLQLLPISSFFLLFFQFLVRGVRDLLFVLLGGGKDGIFTSF